MEQALRPYVTTGIAVVGATALIAAPVAAPPTLPSLQAFAVELTAGFDFGQLEDLGTLSDPLSVYTQLLTNSFDNVSSIVGERLAAPAPILEAIATNQFGYFSQAISDPTSIVGIPGQMFGNAMNVFSALTSLSPDVTLDVPLAGDLFGLITTLQGMTLDQIINDVIHGVVGNSVILTALSEILGDLTTTPYATLSVILPPAMVMGLAGLGPLVNGGDAFAQIMGALQGDVTDSDYLGVLTTLVSSPGFLGDAVLNGQWGLAADLGPLGGLDVPLFNGLLQPIQSVDLSLLDILKVDIGPFTGLFDGFVNYLPQTIADALGEGTTNALPGLGDLFTELPLNLGDFLNLGDLLGGLGLGDLGNAAATGLPLDALTNLFDPSWILALLTDF